MLYHYQLNHDQDYLDDSETVVLHTEGGVNHISNVVLQHPFQGGEEVGIHGLNVIQANALVQQHLQDYILYLGNFTQMRQHTL